MKNKGFTIIETLVAITILVTVIIGAMSAVQSGLSSYTFSKDQVLAFYLAQEGFEQLRNIKDENVINGRHWLYGIAQGSADPCYFGQSCMVNPVESSVPSRCSSPGNCSKLRQDTVNGFYGYNGSWTETRFERDITIASINSNEVSVTVTVRWPRGLSTNTFKARENLFNW